VSERIDVAGLPPISDVREAIEMLALLIVGKDPTPLRATAREALWWIVEAQEPTAAPPAAEPRDVIAFPHLATILAVVRRGVEGDRTACANYALLLADKLETDGCRAAAERVRRAVNPDPSRDVHLMGATPQSPAPREQPQPSPADIARVAQSLAAARKAVQPLIDRDREGERITGELMNMRFRSGENPTFGFFELMAADMDELRAALGRATTQTKEQPQPSEAARKWSGKFDHLLRVRADEVFRAETLALIAAAEQRMETVGKERAAVQQHVRAIQDERDALKRELAEANAKADRLGKGIDSFDYMAHKDVLAMKRRLEGEIAEARAAGSKRVLELASHARIFTGEMQREVGQWTSEMTRFINHIVNVEAEAKRSNIDALFPATPTTDPPASGPKE